MRKQSKILSGLTRSRRLLLGDALPETPGDEGVGGGHEDEREDEEAAVEGERVGHLQPGDGPLLATLVPSYRGGRGKC